MIGCEQARKPNVYPGTMVLCYEDQDPRSSQGSSSQGFSSQGSSIV